MSDQSIDSDFGILCPRCGSRMVVSEISTAGTATTRTVNIFSASASKVEKLYFNQILYICNQCNTTYLKPNINHNK
jgi:DNA-directed RNA polymerase subunit RPC12/RpoP